MNLLRLFRSLVLLGSLLTSVVCVGAPVKSPALDLLRLLRREPGNPAYLDDLKKRLPELTEPAEREVALATCALGLLHNENTPEAVKALRGLTAQFPQSSYLALIRFEELDRLCRRCDGNKTTLTAICLKCQGGKRCMVCNGKGMQVILNNKKVQCSACEGTGRCSVCKGAGRKPEPCKECNGRGSILDHRKIRQTAVGILHDYLKAHDPRGDAEPEAEAESPPGRKR